jgi:hypothetical protein
VNYEVEKSQDGTYAVNPQEEFVDRYLRNGGIFHVSKTVTETGQPVDTR